jgi:glycosyltransferase involved in cell wall biosynthesis
LGFGAIGTRRFKEIYAIMMLTIAICTWNRAKLLELTLTEMRNLQIPSGMDWEVLVVNNNCTDETDEILSRHASHLPLRRLFTLQPRTFLIP